MVGRQGARSASGRDHSDATTGAFALFSVPRYERKIEQVDTLTTPALGLVETAGAIARRTGSELLARRACRAIERLPNVLVVVPDGALWNAALGAAAARSLRGADAVYVALADLLQLPLVTWDREQRERAGRRVRVIAPAR